MTIALQTAEMRIRQQLRCKAVDTISNWEDAAEFCRRLSNLPEERKAGRHYDLPTEAEWEYACRAETTTAFHYGKSLSSAQANFRGDEPYGGGDRGPNLGRTTKVGSYQPNAFGLYDMHGNVWEWCKDWYKEDYYRESPLRDPHGPAKADKRVEGGTHVERGGSWFDAAKTCRSALRGLGRLDEFGGDRGFRVVLRP